VKSLLAVVFLLCAFMSKAQKIERIFVDLYTDSLKKGTYNYINIDGLLPNGKYIPLDSTQLIFETSAGKFSGNSLWISKDITTEKVNIKVTLRQYPQVVKEFEVYIKKNPDPPLKTMDELMKEPRAVPRTKKG
jgi:hypothetical protein